MICKKCHVHVEDGAAAVCPVCGAELEPEEVLMEEVPAGEVPAGEVAAEEGTAELPETTEIAETTEETVPEEEQPAAPKRKTWVKVTAIIACVVLFLGLAAGIWYGINGGFAPRANDVSYKDQYYAEEDKAVKAADEVIATVGGKELTNGQFQVFYWMNIYEFYEQFANHLGYFGLDITKPLSEQYLEEEACTWEQFFINSALDAWHNYQGLLLYAENKGYVMSDTLTEQLDAVIDAMEASAGTYGFANASEMVQADMGPSADIDDYKHYICVSYGVMEYLESLRDEMNPTAAEIEAYFEANADALKTNYGVDKESGKRIDVRHILVCPKGGTADENDVITYSQDEWDACLQEAESLLKQWQEGEATEESFAILASEVSEDPGSKGTGGLYTYVYEGQMVPEFNDWCFDESRQYGDTDIVKTSYGYHIMFFVYGEEGWIRYAEESIIADACSVLMENAMEEYPMEVKYKNIVLGKADMVS